MYPPLSVVTNTTRSLASSPVPDSVMVWPGLAEGTPAVAGVPVPAVAVMPVSRVSLPATRTMRVV